MFFFKKQPTQEPKKPEYPAELDAARDNSPIFIDLSVLEKIISIEGVNLDSPEEETIVYVLSKKDEGECDEYYFRISRKQHRELIEQFSKN